MDRSKSCSVCENINEASCIEMILKIEGEAYKPIPYVALTVEEAVARLLSGESLIVSAEEVERLNKWLWNGRRCPGCNVEDGGYHHDGCPEETCPHCGNLVLDCQASPEFRTVPHE